MTRPPIDTQKTAQAAPQKPADALSHQERVYFEMFRAIEQLGRKLEKAEAERFILARRLSDIEDSAERDENTGRLYLPAKIESMPLPPASAAQRFALPAALASLVLALLTLGAVMMQDLPQGAAVQTQRSAAASFAAPLQQAESLPRGGWHNRATVEETAVAEKSDLPLPEKLPLPEEIVLAEVAPAPLSLPQPAPEAEVFSAAALPPAIAAHEFDADDFDLQLADALDDLAEETASAAADMALAEPSAPHSAQDDVAVSAEAVPTPAQALPEAPPATARSDGTPSITLAAPQPDVPLMRDARLPNALAALEARAFEGQPEAQHDLATLYAEGRSVRRDYARARAWFVRAAAAGIANAHYNLGVMSQQGLGTTADAITAIGHYDHAAQLGHPEAMYNLGLIHAEGRGIPKNAVRATSYFKRAANAGMVQAAYNLGVIYESEALGKPDIKAAIEWYDVAAGEGNRDAALAVRRLTRLQSQQAEARPAAR
jgi:TPR repeat protein